MIKTNNGVTVRRVNNPKDLNAAYVVERDGQIIGMLSKWRTTRSSLHPWKAFKFDGAHSIGIGCDNGRPHTMIGAFYENKDAAVIAPRNPGEPEIHFGGRTAALAAVVAAATQGAV